MVIVVKPARTPKPLAAHHPLGTSTGVFGELRGRWSELVARACDISTYTVELSALSGEELPGLIAYLRSKPALPFRYVSVHAPTKSVADAEAQLVASLAQLPLWIRSIVAHPDTIEAVDLYRPLGSRLVLENMDDRKHSGQTTADLEALFERLPEAGLCLDVAHASSVDPSMELAHELLDRFRSRLRHVHLSSLDDGRHVPLTDADAERFTPVLERCRDVPWILEAAPPHAWRAALHTHRIVQVAAAA